MASVKFFRLALVYIDYIKSILSWKCNLIYDIIVNVSIINK